MLTPKQKKCVELMVSGELKQKEIAAQINVSEQTICAWKKNADFMAAIRAGYSVKTANEQGSQNLAKLNIQTAIAERMAERSRRTGVNQDRGFE